MNSTTTTSSLLRKLGGALLAIACLFSANSAFSDEAYLGVGGFITRVSVEPIIETTMTTTSTLRATCDRGETTMGFKIKNVEADSPADYAGLRRGDVLLEADGIALSSYSSLARMRRALADLGEVEVYFLRNGSLRTAWVGEGAGVPTATAVR